MRTIWKRAPLLRLVVPWIGGLVCADLLHNWTLPLMVMICSLTTVVVGYQAYQQWFNQRHWLGLAILLGFFGMGWLYGLIRQECMLPTGMDTSTERTWLVRLTESPLERERSFRCIAEVCGEIGDSAAAEPWAKVLVYFQKSNGIDALKPDDVVQVVGRMQPLSGPKAPGEFNMQRHGRRKGIHLQLYSDSLHWKKVWTPNDHSIQFYMEHWRNRALDCLRERHVESLEYGVLAALILGDTSDMDPELMTSYASAGVVHVLAVSGLHVGLVYMLLTPLFRFIFGRSKGRWLRTLLPVALLWMYSGLSGGSPSVLRAAVMFSGFIFADNFGKHNNIYNTLASSAFVLLLFRPSMFFDLGFQLSYLAVIGIVILQKPLASLVHVPNKWLDRVWTMSAVSVAAQISTLPLTLFYFHQFPNYFLASNLFVIPWSTLIIYISIVFYIALPWPWMAQFIVDVLIGMTRVMNRVITWFEQLPCSVTTDIPCDTVQFFTLSLMLFFGLRWLFWRRSAACLVVLSIGVVHMGYGWLRQASVLQSEEAFLCTNYHSLAVAHRSADRMAWYLLTDAISDKGYGWSNYMRDKGIVLPPDTIAIGADQCPLYKWNETLVYLADSAALSRYGWVQCDVMVLHHLGGFRFDAEKMDRVRNVQIALGPGISKRKLRWIQNQWSQGLDCIALGKGTWVVQDGRLHPFSDGQPVLSNKNQMR